MLDQSSFVGGPEVDQFELDFRQLVGNGEVVTCANGTDSMK
ncbi:MAG TPA: hypothetical protein ENH91_14690 [Leeuwenhoekiella sp.]|nr:hypothetical protein [Leeuwenhoekiella sp.]